MLYSCTHMVTVDVKGLSFYANYIFASYLHKFFYRHNYYNDYPVKFS